MTNPQLVAMFFVQAAVILAACRAVGWLGRFVGQPQVVGEMVAGLVLGPSVLGLALPQVKAWLFPVESTPIIYAIAQIGLVLYMFLMGARFRMDLALARGKAAASVSLAGIVAPFALGVGLAWWLHGDKQLFAEHVTLTQAALFMGAAMSITAFPMLARIIEEQGLVGTSLGALALSAASLDDVLAWCVLAVVLATTGDASGWVAGAKAVGGGIAYVLVVFYIIKPLLARLVSKSQDGVISAGMVAGILVLLFAGAWCSDAIGVHAVFGAFFMGLAVPRGEFAERLYRMMSPLTGGLLLPMFFVYSGLNTRIGLIGTWQLAGVAGLVMAAACVGKFVACAAGARLSGVSGRESLAIGSLMNARGMTGLIILNIGLERGILTPTLFTIGVVMAVVTTLMATPCFRLFHRDDPGDLSGGGTAAERGARSEPELARG
jgi:Kef-type K+ transport system membrane component KefB